MRLRFAGEADDEGGADGEIRDSRPQAVDEVFDVLARGFAAHEVQHVAMDVLERHVDIARHLGVPGDGLDQVVAPVAGWV